MHSTPNQDRTEMRVDELLADLNRCGIRLRLDDAGKMHARGLHSALTPELRDRIHWLWWDLRATLAAQPYRSAPTTPSSSPARSRPDANAPSPYSNCDLTDQAPRRTTTADATAPMDSRRAHPQCRDQDPLVDGESLTLTQVAKILGLDGNTTIRSTALKTDYPRRGLVERHSGMPRLGDARGPRYLCGPRVRERRLWTLTVRYTRL